MNVAEMHRDHVLGVVALTTIALFITGRFLVEVIGLPRLMYFALFPILVTVMFVQRSTGTEADRFLVRAVMLVTLAVFVSSVTAFSDPLVTVLLWSSIATPFVTALVAYRAVAGLQFRAQRLRLLLISILAVQTLVVGLEVLAGDRADFVQGLLQGQGAAAHIVGFVSAFYVIVFLALALDGIERWGTVVAVLAVGVGTIAFTDTDQAVVVLGLTVSTHLVGRLIRWKPPIHVVLPILSFIVFLASWGQLSYRSNYGSDYLTYKGAAVTALFSEAAQRPESVLFGFGPGQTLTRVAWNSIRPDDNLTRIVGGPPGEIALRVISLDEDRPPWRQSSFTSVFFSLGGILGDLGVFGLGAYVGAWILLYRAASTTTKRVSGSVIGMALLVGGISNGLEEPVLMAIVGLALAFLVVRSEDVADA